MPMDAANLRRPGRPRPDEAQRLHQQILETAFRSFLLHGFAQTTIKGIAEACSTTRVSVTSRFPTKDDLFAEVAVLYSERFLEKILAIDIHAQDAVEGLRLMSREILRCVLDRDYVAFHSTCSSEIQRLPELAERLIAINDKLSFEIEKAVIAAQGQGAFREHSAWAIACAIIGVMISNPFNRARLRDPQFRDEHGIDMYFSQVWPVFLALSRPAGPTTVR